MSAPLKPPTILTGTIVAGDRTMIGCLGSSSIDCSRICDVNEIPLEDVVRNVNGRLGLVEQILPTLATREELRVAVAPLATRGEMHAAIQAAIAPLATREELHAAIQAAVAPL